MGGIVAGEVSVGDSETNMPGTPGAATEGPVGSPVVRARDLRRDFDGRAVLDHLDLDVGAGEFLSIIGPSGCGKTTLLGLIAGLLAPTAGTVEVRATPLAYVFQEPALMPWRTVAQNAALLAEVSDVPRAQCDDRVEEALALVGLGEVADALPHTLSGGMQMRTSLARALVTRPALLLADEPFGALDAMTRTRLDAELAALSRRQGLTTVMVTHAIDEAVMVSDRVVVLGGAPATVVASVEIPLGDDRGPHTRFDPVAIRLTAELLDALEVAP